MNIFTRFVAVSVATAATLISVPAQAHVMLGSYQGFTAARANCSVEIKSISFENGIPHPLNERVTISYEGATYVLGHSPVLDTATGMVRFNHDDLRTVIATETGAKAVVLKLSHDEKKEGPTELLILEDNYGDTTQNTRTSCGELEHVNATRAQTSVSVKAFNALNAGAVSKTLATNPAPTVQYIDCSDTDAMSNDKIIISLRANDVGTLFISSGVEAPEPNNSGVLPLHRSEVQDRAGFINYTAKNTLAGFRVSIPSNIIGKSADGFYVSLDGQMNDGSFGHGEDFVCFTRMY